MITIIVTVVLLLSDITGIKGNPSPKKRKPSSSSTSDSSSNARPASGSSGSRYNPTNWKNPIKSKPHKPKSSISKKPFSKKNFKKALAFGAGAYISYKISKKVSKKVRRYIPLGMTVTSLGYFSFTEMYHNKYKMII